MTLKTGYTAIFTHRNQMCRATTRSDQKSGCKINIFTFHTFIRNIQELLIDTTYYKHCTLSNGDIIRTLHLLTSLYLLVKVVAEKQIPYLVHRFPHILTANTFTSVQSNLMMS